MTDVKRIGNIGEKLTAKFYRKHGYRVIGKNVRVSHKEIDLIVSDRSDIVFVEVKTRMYEAAPDVSVERPASAVDAEKRRNTVSAASVYLKSHPADGKNVRFDVVEIYLTRSDSLFRKYKIYSLNHVPNAFSAFRR